MLMDTFNAFAFAVSMPVPPTDIEARAVAFLTRYPERETWKKLLAHRWRHKVCIQMYRNALELRGTAGDMLGQYLVESLREDAEKRISMRSVVFPRTHDLLEATLGSVGVDYLLIKGACFAQLYDVRSPRQSNDMDILVRSVDDLMLAIDTLCSNGFIVRFDDTPYLAGGSRPAVAGSGIEQFVTGAIEIEITYPDGTSGCVDLHIGHMPINDVGHTITSPIWERRQGQYPSWEDSLLILAGHAAGHGGWIQKDLNDAYQVLAAHGADLDWPYVEHWARRSGLWEVLSAIIQLVQFLYPRVEGLPELPWRSDILTRQVMARGYDQAWARTMLHMVVARRAFSGVSNGESRRQVGFVVREAIVHVLGERFYRFPVISGWLERLEAHSAAIPPATGQRLYLINADEVLEGELPEEDNGPTSIPTLRAFGVGRLVSEPRAQLLWLAQPACGLVPTATAMMPNWKIQSLLRMREYALTEA